MPAFINAVKEIFIDRCSFLNRLVCPFPGSLERSAVFRHDTDAVGLRWNTVFYFNHTNPPSLRENEPECQKIVIIRFSQM